MSENCHNGPWKLHSLLKRANVSIPIEISEGITVTGVTDDSRAVRSGDCFVAVRGRSADGHRCVGQAIESGAAAVIVQDDVARIGDVPVVRVADSRLALARLAAARFGIDQLQRDGRLRLVGVTGTNGKTTVCALVRAILQRADRVTASFGTLCNDTIRRSTPASMTTMGPLALCEALAESVDAGATDAVLEVSSHALDQHRCGGLRFAVGVFTNLSQDHLDYHETVADYARAKRRLFDQLDGDAVAVVNDDDRYGRYMIAAIGADGANVLRYGRTESADIAAKTMQLSGDRTRLEIARRDCSDLIINSPLVGMHNAHNTLAAVAVATALNVPDRVICDAIETFGGVPGRLQPVLASELPYRVYVDYAHTPDALAKVLASVREVTRGRVICVFGCGGDRDRGKRPLMGEVVARAADVAVVTSDNPRSEDPLEIIEQVATGMTAQRSCSVIRDADRRQAIRTAVAMAQADDTVVVAGKGHEQYQIIGGDRIAFDDVHEAREAIELCLGAAT